MGYKIKFMKKTHQITIIGLILITLCIAIYAGLSFSPREYRNINPFYSSIATYTSGTGTAGVANTAQVIISRTLSANTLQQAGDRLRVRVYAISNLASPLVLSMTINGVSIASVSVGSATVPGIIECLLDYVDNTHSNILEQQEGNVGILSAVNVAGFSWNSSMTISISQNAVNNNFFRVYDV